MNHEKTIKRIQELVPSTVQTAPHLFKGNNLRCSHCGATVQQDFDGIECTEILGKPITIAVVLLAIDINSTDSRWKIIVGCNFMRIQFGESYALWNLSKDNFNDQSEETKTFIGELITNNI